MYACMNESRWRLSGRGRRSKREEVRNGEQWVGAKVRRREQNPRQDKANKGMDEKERVCTRLW